MTLAAGAVGKGYAVEQVKPRSAAARAAFTSALLNVDGIWGHRYRSAESRGTAVLRTCGRDTCIFRR